MERRQIHVIDIPKSDTQSEDDAISIYLRSLSSNVKKHSNDTTCDILVVDDSLALVEGLKEFLSEVFPDYRIETALDGLSASHSIGKLRPKLVLLDIMMPRMDGYELLKIIRSDPELKSTKVAFLTARGEKADIDRGLSLGADAYITKPFDDDELINSVKLLLNIN